jgi:hypothetical protein
MCWKFGFSKGWSRDALLCIIEWMINLVCVHQWMWWVTVLFLQRSIWETSQVYLLLQKGRAAPCPYDLKRDLINNLLTAARSIISRENEDKRYSCKRSCIVPLFSHTFFPSFFITSFSVLMSSPLLFIRWGASQVFFFLVWQWANLIGPSLQIKETMEAPQNTRFYFEV